MTKCGAECLCSRYHSTYRVETDTVATTRAFYMIDFCVTVKEIWAGSLQVYIDTDIFPCEFSFSTSVYSVDAIHFQKPLIDRQVRTG